MADFLKSTELATSGKEEMRKETDAFHQKDAI
jgi:hypothetical protein